MDEEYSPYANEAGLQWQIDNQFLDFKTDIHFHGFNDKMPVLLEKFALKIATVGNDVDENIFNARKIKYLNYWERLNSKEAELQIKWFQRQCLDEFLWTKDEIMNATKRVQYRSWKKFVPRLLSRIFVQGLIVGNCNKQKALEIINIIEKPFKMSSGLLGQELLPVRPVLVNKNVHYVHTIHSRRSGTFFYSVYFQFNPESRLYYIMNVVGLLYMFIVNEACQKILPTDEGHTSLCGVATRNGDGAVFITLYSNKHSPSHVDSLVENFLETTHETLKNMTIAELEEYKRKLRTKAIEEPSKSSYWREITEQTYDFERHDVQLEHLLFLQKPDIMTFFEEVLDASSGKRRKIAFHILPEKKTKDRPMRNKTTTQIKNFVAFKSASSLLPIGNPYIDTNSLEIIPS